MRPDRRSTTTLLLSLGLATASAATLELGTAAAQPGSDAKVAADSKTVTYTGHPGQGRRR